MENLLSKKYKILTLCAGGCVRSVGLKYLLKYKYGHESLACGQDANSPETREMLYKWADYIIVVTENYFKEVPAEYHNKTLIYEIGPDTYGYAFNPDLLQKSDKLIQEHGLFNK